MKNQIICNINAPNTHSALPRKCHRVTLALALILQLNACGGGGGSTTADNGAAPSASARTSVIASGDVDCPNGGVLVESGIDENKNGVLDDAEVDDSEKVCNGIDSHNSLIALNDEPAGANCPYGGIRIDSGLDSDDSGVLDSSEVGSTGYVCNQLDGSIGWQVATLVEKNNAGDALVPRIRFDTAGNAMAVWQQHDGVRFNIISNRYTPDTGWGRAELVENDNTGDALNVELATDGDGNSIALWQQHDGTRYNIWSNRYVAGTGWDTPELVETDNAGSATFPVIAFDHSGNAFAVWQQNDGIRNNIWSNSYLQGVGWGAAELIETDDTGSAAYPRIAIDANGNALAVWQQNHEVGGNIINSIWSNRYTSGVGWGSAELIESEDIYDTQGPRIGLDANGNALAVWYQRDGSRHYNIWSNRYTAGVGWGTAELIDTDDAHLSYNPQVSIDINGDALAVWWQFDAFGQGNIWANRYTSGAGWGTPELIETDNSGSASDPQVSIGANGNALAVWYQNDGNNVASIWSNRYVSGVGWGNSELIETNDAGSAVGPQVDIDTNGNALAVWYQFDGTRNNIWSNYWVAP